MEALLARLGVRAPYELRALADGYYQMLDAHGAWTLRREESPLAPALAQELVHTLAGAGLNVAVAPFVEAPGCHWHLTRIADGVVAPHDCARAGERLARAHLAAGAIGGRDNPYDGAWRKIRAAQISSSLTPAHAALLAAELQFQALYRFADLPRGVVFGDGARDLGRVDARYVCRDVWLWDLALAAEHWCCVDDGLAREHIEALLAAYHRLRPLTAIERGAWPVLLRRAALQRALGLHFSGASDAQAWTALTTRVHESKFVGKLWPSQRDSTTKGG